MCNKHAHTLKNTQYVSGKFNHTLIRTQDQNKQLLQRIVNGSINLEPQHLSRSVKSFGSLNTWNIVIYTTTVVLHSQLSLSRAWRTMLWNKPVCPLLSWVIRTRPSGRGLWTRTNSPWSRLSSESVWAKCVVVTLCLENKNKRCHRFLSSLSNQAALLIINVLFIFKDKQTKPTYLLGLNWADTADSDGCDNIGFCGLEFRSEVAVSLPFLRIGAFPSLRMIPGPSLPSVSDGAHTSNAGGPGRELEGTWFPDDQEEVRGLGGGESSSVKNRTDFARYGSKIFTVRHMQNSDHKNSVKTMHTEYLTSDKCMLMPLARNHQYDITFSVLFLCESGLTRIEWGPLGGCLSCWNVATCEAVKSLSLKTAAAEGTAGSVIQPRGLPELDRMLLYFFLCRAGE